MNKRVVTKLINIWGYDLIPRIEEDQTFFKYKDKHKGKRCVIVGNGPSLNKTNLNLLENEITFGLNKIFLLFPKVKFRPTYLVCGVPDVIKQCKEKYKKLSIPLFVVREGKEILKERTFETHYFGPFKRFTFSLNPVKEICIGHSVTYVTMQLAFFMGFQQVILIGVDHSFNYDGPSDKWHAIDKQTKGRHFVDNYFAPGQTWQSPNLEQAAAHYAFAKAVYERFDREIIDCTVKGKLDVFKKSTLEEIL